MNIRIGIEMAHSFGDAMFSTPLIKKLSEIYNTKITVAVEKRHEDAYYNLPWVSDLININNMTHGVDILRSKGYNVVIQATPNIKFFEYQAAAPDHSLIDTPLLVAREHDIGDFDQRPIFIPTAEELKVLDTIPRDKPIIAVESVYNSGQSWCDQRAIDSIVAKYVNTHYIIWLSNRGAPSHPNVLDMLQFSRRQCIVALRLAETFFSVGSGFFCASMAYEPKDQPKRTVCMWIDELYKYKNRLNELGWNKNITWVHSHAELAQAL